MEVKRSFCLLQGPEGPSGQFRGPPPASYRARPGRWDPRARQQSQNTNVKTCGRDREGVRLVSALTTHPTGFTWRIRTLKHGEIPPEFGPF